MSQEGDAKLFEIMKSQMGIDPSKCDPVTLDLMRQKFFGRKDEKKSKKEKSKANNVIDKTGEADDGFRKEKDIHLKSKFKTKESGKTVKQQLDFADIFDSIEKKETTDVINTTKMKKQLKNLKRDASK